MRRRQVRPDSDEMDRAIYGYVLANRINDMTASPNSNAYRDYLRIARSEWLSQPVLDEKAHYRAEAKAKGQRALDALERRDGVTIERGWVYYHENETIRLAALPDGMEGKDLGFTTHVRRNPKTYDTAEDAGVTPAMFRDAQAMMLLTGAPNWIELNYLENLETGERHISDHLVRFNQETALHLEEEMLAFLLRSRQQCSVDSDMDLEEGSP